MFKLIKKLVLNVKLDDEITVKNFNKSILLFTELLDKIRNNQITLDEENKKIHNALSILFGASLGDAMGAYCEFNSPNNNNHKNIWKDISPIFKTGRGQVTDDTEMAMSMAYGLLESVHEKLDDPKFLKFDQLGIPYYYGVWYISQPFDIGNTTRNALHLNNMQDELEKGLENCSLHSDFFRNSSIHNKESLSNGFLMRRTPYTVFLYYFFEMNKDKPFFFKTLVDKKKYENLFYVIYDAIRDEVEMTHTHKECRLVAVFYDFIVLCCIYYLKDGNDTSIIMEKISEFFTTLLNFDPEEDNERRFNYFKKNIQNLKDVFDEVNKFESFEEGLNSQYIGEIGVKFIGLYSHAFKLIFFVLKFYSDIYKMDKDNVYINIMNSICDLGGDTDTNCCIVGGVVGAMVKLDKIGNEYLNPHISFNSLGPTTHRRRWVIYSPIYLGFYAIKLNDIMKNPENRKE